MLAADFSIFFRLAPSPPPRSTSGGRPVHWLRRILGFPIVCQQPITHCYQYLIGFLPTGGSTCTYRVRSVPTQTQRTPHLHPANAKIMKPAPLQLQLGMHIFISRVFKLADSFPATLKFDSVQQKDILNVSLALLFIPTKRWILIITWPVACLDVSGGLRNEKKQRFFHFYHSWCGQGSVIPSHQKCEQRRVNN